MRSVTLLMLSAAACLLAGAEPVRAGAYVFAGESNGVDVVAHPTGYTGPAASGPLSVSVCIDPTSSNASQMEIPVQNVVHTWNARVPVTGNLLFGGANDIPSGAVDFESLVVHELGHCIGLAHTNLASESGLSDPQRNYTRSTDGADGFDLDDGADDTIGSNDDQRGDDVNLHWFRTSNNNPFTIASTVDSTTYSRDLADLPGSDSFPANADRTVAALLGVPNTEAAMQQGSFADEDQRRLAHDDVATLEYGMSGVDELEGTSDDYTLSLTYAGLSASCDIVIDFDDTETGFAVCQTSGTFIPGTGGTHVRITDADIFFNTGFNWHFNDTLSACGNGSLDDGEDCDDGNTNDGDCCSSSCLFEPGGSLCDDEDACTDGETCDGAGTCQGGSAVSCDDGLFCNGDETCDTGSGCQAGTPPAVDDGVACTEDSCDEIANLVVNTPNDASCDDEDACTADSCDALLGCAHEPIVGCSSGGAPLDSAAPWGYGLLAVLLLATGALAPGLRRRGDRSPSA